jgi:hypothetical protein
MDPINVESSSTNDYVGKDNCSYVRSSSDVHLSTLNEEESTAVKLPSRAISIPSSAFSAIYEVPTTDTNMPASGPPPSASSASFTQQQTRKSNAVGPHERQLSILDPMSDRVSTILVWKNLTVQARPNKREEFFKRMKSYKDFVPTRKFLLHNTSGVIAGGLWAVMGKFSFLLEQIKSILNLIIIIYRSIWFW